VPREQVAGALVLNRLRGRIASGLFLGQWRPGDRLPSIRDIADAEGVDRKTAAAAYRRLEEEGLVRVHARSGVYLAHHTEPPAGGPLAALHRRWLEQTVAGARALGLDTGTVLRMIQAVAEVEAIRIPVVECNLEQADTIARELRERLGVRAVPVLIDELRPAESLIVEAPVVVTTPFHAAETAALLPGRPLVEATLRPELIRALAQAAAEGLVLVVVPNELQAEKVRRSLAAWTHRSAGRIQVATLDELSDLQPAPETVFVWPGCQPRPGQRLPAGGRRIDSDRALSDETLHHIQDRLLRAALRRVGQGNGSGVEEVVLRTAL
jgi:GntR family transcriptional regulator